MSIRVELRHGGLEAVVVETGEVDDPAKTAPLVLEELKRLGVSSLPTSAEVVRALQTGDTRTGAVVARGTPPQPGIGAHVVLLAPVKDTPLDDDADPLETYWQNVVYPSALILRKTPASEGIPGRSLLDSPLPARAGADVPVVVGDGVSVSSSGLEFRSTTYGVSLFHNGRLRVADAVHVSDDRMEARVTVLPDPSLGEAEHLEAIVGALGALGVKKGIDREALGSAVRAAQVGNRPASEILAAQGQLPVDGAEVDYRVVIDLEKKAFKMLDGERADFRETDSVKNVNRGEVLAEVLRAQLPVPGFRVDGTVLQPKARRAQGLKPGDHTEISEDGSKVVADADGMVIIKGGKFHVVDEYVIPEDVDFSTGNVRASGTVRIRGQIKPGFIVEAGRDVEVAGDVWEATVASKGDVRVRGAITAGSRVSGRNVSARFVQNSRVEAEGDLEVNLSITSSEIYIRGKLSVLGSQGVILGGEVNAAKGLEARTIGSEESRTKIVVGQDLRVVREMESIGKSRAACTEELRSLAGTLSKEFLKDPRGALLALPPALRKSKIETLQRMKELQEKDTGLAQRYEELQKLSLEEQGAQIIVHGEIHAGTQVTVGRARTTLTETLRRAALHYDAEHNCVGWRRL